MKTMSSGKLLYMMLFSAIFGGVIALINPIKIIKNLWDILVSSNNDLIKEKKKIERTGVDIIFMLDVSGSMLAEDIKVREYLKTKLKNASVSKVLIERPAKNAKITIYSSRPGVVIGKKGEDIEVLRKELQKRMGVPVHVNIEEIRKLLNKEQVEKAQSWEELAQILMMLNGITLHVISDEKEIILFVLIEY